MLAVFSPKISTLVSLSKRILQQAASCPQGSAVRLTLTRPNATASRGLNVMTFNAYMPDNGFSMRTAINPTTGDQTTRYVYGTTLADSQLASNDLLAAEIYPDSADAADRIPYLHNRQGQRTQTTDQNGTLHAYVYDLLGRPTADQATVPPGIDPAILRRETAYEVRGMVTQVTSYDSTTGGAVVNQVVLSYNDFGQLQTDQQTTGSAEKPRASCSQSVTDILVLKSFAIPKSRGRS